MKFLLETIKREFKRLTSRTAYLFAMIIVPLGCTWFFISLMNEGLPLKVPTAIVDLDHSSLSRQVTRSLDSEELIDITSDYESYAAALSAVKRGDVYGFFLIPEGFERNAVSGRSPSLEYYSNLTYFVPGTLAFKGFKTMAVMSSAGMVKTRLVSIGATDDLTTALIQPVTFDTHPIGNPWTNYSIYLTPSFMLGVLALMVMLVTAFSITIEIKRSTSPQWLDSAGGSIIVAVTGKLLPQTLIFTIIGWGIEAILFKYFNFPLAGDLWVLIAAMPLYVIANQSFALFFCSLIPNPRLSLSVCALISILAFSFAGFSFPVTSMYGAISIFSYIVPVRWFFQLYINEALMGAPIYFSRMIFAALMLFPLVAMLPLGRLKKACRHPVYVP